MGRIQDDKHSLRLDFWSPDDYDIEVIHPQSCSIWWGCDIPKKDRDQSGFPHPLDPCPQHHHAHHRYDCPLGYMVENIGIGDTLFNYDTEFEEEALAVLKRYIEQPVPIHYDFSWGVSGYYEQEYDEELLWMFNNYYTHTWRHDAAICALCGTTAAKAIQEAFVPEVSCQELQRKELEHGIPDDTQPAQ